MAWNTVSYHTIPFSYQSWWTAICACWWIVVYPRPRHMWPNPDQTDVATSTYRLCHSTKKWTPVARLSPLLHMCLIAIFGVNSQMVSQLGWTLAPAAQAFRKFELLSRVLNGRAVSHPHHMRIDTGADVHLHGIYPAEAWISEFAPGLCGASLESTSSCDKFTKSHFEQKLPLLWGGKWW